MIKPTPQDYALSTFSGTFKIIGKIMLVAKWEQFVGYNLTSV